jgi:hypothetical protein
MIMYREVYPDGSSYEGDFLAGKRFRRGTITYLNGTKFTGDWQYGRKQGKGSMHYNDGTRYYYDNDKCVQERIMMGWICVP